jgi:hypothetical protein
VQHEVVNVLQITASFLLEYLCDELCSKMLVKRKRGRRAKGEKSVMERRKRVTECGKELWRVRKGVMESAEKSDGEGKRE